MIGVLGFIVGTIIGMTSGIIVTLAAIRSIGDY